MKRRKNTIKRKNIRRHNFIVLTRLILCIVLISITFIVTLNKKENSKKTDIIISETETETETKKDPFDGIPVINDNRGVPVICYHSINKDPSGKSSVIVSKEKFRQHLQTIKDEGYITLTMTQINDYLLKNKPIPEKSIVITFDDGYRDNYTNAFPILKEFNMNATIFVISSYLNRDSCLTSQEIKEISDYGIDIESHTVSHAKLSTLSYEDQLKELKDSKETIESITEKPVISVAYPEGKFDENTKKATLEAGYSMGFTIKRGYADRNDNQVELNRICVDYTYKPNNIVNVLKNLPK